MTILYPKSRSLYRGARISRPWNAAIRWPQNIVVQSPVKPFGQPAGLRRYRPAAPSPVSHTAKRPRAAGRNADSRRRSGRKGNAKHVGAASAELAEACLKKRRRLAVGGSRRRLSFAGPFVPVRAEPPDEACAQESAGPRWFRIPDVSTRWSAYAAFHRTEPDPNY